MTPVEDNITAVVEFPPHTDGRISTCIARKQVVVEGGVFTAPRAAEGVVLSIKSFAGNAVLYSQILHRHFQTTAVGQMLHVTIEREVFIHAPTGTAMVHDNPADGIATNVVGTLAPLRTTAPDPQVTQNDVLSIDVQ
jgi:hypothetical protein